MPKTHIGTPLILLLECHLLSTVVACHFHFSSSSYVTSVMNLCFCGMPVCIILNKHVLFIRMAKRSQQLTLQRGNA